MQWQRIRAHYERLFAEAKTRGETQESVARRGGLRQARISELLSMGPPGPQAETLVCAIEGLGLSVSAFFAALEGDKNSVLRNRKDVKDNPTLPLEVSDADSEVARAAHTLAVALTRRAMAARDQSPDPAQPDTTTHGPSRRPRRA